MKDTCSIIKILNISDKEKKMRLSFLKLSELIGYRDRLILDLKEYESKEYFNDYNLFIDACEGYPDFRYSQLCKELSEISTIIADKHYELVFLLHDFGYFYSQYGDVFSKVREVIRKNPKVSINEIESVIGCKRKIKGVIYFMIEKDMIEYKYKSDYWVLGANTKVDYWKTRFIFRE